MISYPLKGKSGQKISQTQMRERKNKKKRVITDLRALTGSQDYRILKSGICTK